MDLDSIMRSKYTSLFCALLNAAVAINCAVNGSWFWFALTGIFAAYCFRNFIEAR